MQEINSYLKKLGENHMSSTATLATSITQPSTNAENAPIEKFRISIQLIGIKRRCRKSERHFFHFGHLPYNNGEYNQGQLKNEVIAWIHTNIKEVHSQVRVSLDHVTISSERGFTHTQWEPFSKLNTHFDFSYHPSMLTVTR